MSEEKPHWQLTRLESVKWHIKNYLGAAALFGIMALAVILYFAATALLSGICRDGYLKALSRTNPRIN